MPLLESDRFAKMLETVSSSFDWVILDPTPLLPMADSTSLSRLCDGVLVVVREGYTRRRVLNKALASIEKQQTHWDGSQPGLHVEHRLRPLLRQQEWQVEEGA